MNNNLNINVCVVDNAYNVFYNADTYEVVCIRDKRDNCRVSVPSKDTESSIKSKLYDIQKKDLKHALKVLYDDACKRKALLKYQYAYEPDIQEIAIIDYKGATYLANASGDYYAILPTKTPTNNIVGNLIVFKTPMMPTLQELYIPNANQEATLHELTITITNAKKNYDDAIANFNSYAHSILANNKES